MFIGHYAAAFAAKAVRPVVPLWLLFVAVQLVDFGWAILVILDIEHVRIIPGFTASNPLDLYHMPYTHSLVAGVIWSVAFALLYITFKRGGGKVWSGVILGLAVFSHWLTDLIVHVPDLPLIYGDPKFGFGLWHHFLASQVLEIGLLALAVIWFVSATDAKNGIGRVAPWLLLVFMGALQLLPHFLSPPAEPSAFAAQGLIVYTGLAALAWLVETNRRAKVAEPAA